jgi:hypothetical protein
MAQKIQGIFVDPPIAIARLGSSNVPQDAYRWVEALNPRTDGNTVIDPWWTLDVNSDGSVEPRKSDTIHLRDGDLIRPVAPFFEIWALLGEDGSPPSRWREVPLTPALLKQFGADESAVTLSIDAKNRKAARRTGNGDLVFGTFPPVAVSANNHDMHTLFGVSPLDAKRPMIPKDRNIPLGSIQIMLSRPKTSAVGASWENDVDVEIMRFRFTPGRGRFYGPKQAARPVPRATFAAVEKINAFLDDKAGWYNQPTLDIFEPNDTEDTRDNTGGSGPSLGVVDDTCEARVDVTLTLAGTKKRKGKSGKSGANRTFQTHANVFVGPPDFAPDRRPFLSLADELSDRSNDAAKRDAALNDQDKQAWVSDLFERIYETVSLLNLDHYQQERSITLQGDALRTKPVPKDSVSKPVNGAMTKMDALRNPDTPVGPVSAGKHLPLTEHAKDRHSALQDITELQEFLSKYPGRLQLLVRGPFEVTPGETADDAGTSSMRMPPFMRHSSGFPLTLSNWQYQLLMRWVSAERPIPQALLDDPDRKLSKMAKARRDAVLARLGG